MRLLFVLVLVTYTAASTSFHYTPTKLLLQKVSSANTDTDLDAAPANTQYHEQDSDGFYSYGYSADRSAKAEYLTVDGSSKGFYSYIDANGKLQTVKYEAGRQQGFKAAATNLPKAPKNLKAAAPVPVKDTPEVQQAKKAHFEAYREAELRAALATQNDATDADQRAQMQQKAREPQPISADARNRILAILAESSETQSINSNNLKNSAAKGRLNSNQVQLQVGASVGASGNSAAASATADINDGPSYQRGFLSFDDIETSANNADSDADVDGVTNNPSTLIPSSDLTDADANDELSVGHRQMTTYKLPDLLDTEDEQLSDRIHYAYTNGQEEQDTHEKSLLRLAALERKADERLVSPKLTTIETVHVPVHSYYTVLAPNTKYKVITPTTLKAVPREEALKRGHSLPISLSSSFLSHRLKAN